MRSPYAHDKSTYTVCYIGNCESDFYKLVDKYSRIGQFEENKFTMRDKTSLFCPEKGITLYHVDPYGDFYELEKRSTNL